MKRPKRGRQSPYRERYAAVAEKLCRLGATTPDIAVCFGVSDRTIENWMAKHKAFGRAVKDGKAAADGVDRALFRQTMDCWLHGESEGTTEACVSDVPTASPATASPLEAESVRQNAEPDRLSTYSPYPRQAEFHALGATKRERLLMAANRFGKTECGAAEMAMHLSGRYPAWWRGKRFQQPVRAWAAGITNESTRDVVQAKLIGPPERREAWGTGLIAHECMGETFLAYRVPNALDTVSVKHVSGGFSSLQFKSYERGREKWQGTALEVVWFDEEPPLDIYLEGLTRTNETGGLVYVTFTPLLGHTDVVGRFLGAAHDDRAIVGATIFDAGHFSEAERERIVASYPAHQRDARVKGMPVLGSGHVFPIAEESIRCEPFVIPPHWAQINGLDFGWDHPFGAVNCAWDRDADVFYVCKEYREREATPLVHAAAVKPWGEWIPCAWPHDGLQHDKGSGEELARAYATHGLQMLPERATFEDGTNGVEAGVLEMLERMQTGRWKVFSTCGAWFDEFRLYHREEGRIVKINDDLISASRYAYMMRRLATTKPRRRTEREPRGAQGWMA